MSNKMKLPPAVLAFSRKLEPSDALFFSGKWDNRDNANHWSPIAVREKSVRATKSSYGETKPEDANPQTGDVASLPDGHDTLKVDFTLRILGNVGTPSACSEHDVGEKIKEIVNNYTKTHKFQELAQRYATNLANGRFLWRNRIGARDISINITHIAKGEAESKNWIFDAFKYSLQDPKSLKEEQGILDLATVIQQGFLEDNDHQTILRITAFVCLGNRQEVFPSQEMVMDKSRGENKKILYSIDGVAAMHSQKIGNALRTIDDWYKEASQNGLIAVEPYGSVTTQGKAWRKDKEQKFYTIFYEWIRGEEPGINEQHYAIATLIRGGVFGG